MTPESSSQQDASPRDYSHAWRALRHRNFRLFFGGQSISLIGTWMTRIATSWLVYRLTKSPLLLGTVGFAGQIPTFLLAPIAGVIVDRIDRRKVLVWTQSLAMRSRSLSPGSRCPVESPSPRFWRSAQCKA
jgi:MFS family permease